MKLKEFQAYLRTKKLDVVFLAHPDPAVTYFTQIRPSYGYLVITPTHADAHLTALDAHPTIQHITVKTLRKNWHKKYHDPKKIGINKEVLTLSQLEKLKKLFPAARFTDVGTQLHRLRSQKTPKEIAKITAACTMTSAALQALTHKLPTQKLKTERDVAEFLEQYIKQQGGEIAFPTIVAMGKNAAIPHHKTSTAELHRGFLLLDFGAQVHNYCADMTRVLFLGTPTAKERQWYQLLLHAQQQAIDHISSQGSFTDLDKITRKHLAPYSSYFTHSLGHGIGIEVHEAPHFFDKNETIQKNQVFTIEPGIYFPGKFGLRIEDTLLFDGAVKILTTFPKELFIIPW